LLPSEPTNSCQRGLTSEALAEKYFARYGWRIERRRWKTPFAEIDLCFVKGTERLLVEVKSMGALSEDFIETRMSARQKDRLLKSRLWIEETFSCEVQAVVAFVRLERNEIDVIPFSSF
jgi:Holliday junction resolvase-like predicted endonuclease